MYNIGYRVYILTRSINLISNLVIIWYVSVLAFSIFKKNICDLRALMWLVILCYSYIGMKSVKIRVGIYFLMRKKRVYFLFFHRSFFYVPIFWHRVQTRLQRALYYRVGNWIIALYTRLYMSIAAEYLSMEYSSKGLREKASN